MISMKHPANREARALEPPFWAFGKREKFGRDRKTKTWYVVSMYPYPKKVKVAAAKRAIEKKKVE